MFKMEASSDNEADPEFSHSTIESVYIKEEPPEDMGNTEHSMDTLKMETVSKDEADPTTSHCVDQPVLALKIKERWQYCQNALKDQPVVTTIKKEAVSNDEADPSVTVTHSTEPGLVLKIKERWQYCQNVWKQQSNMNEPIDIEAESNETESLQLRCHKVPAEDHIQDVKPVTWHKVQHTTSSPDSETSMSSEDVPVPDHDIMESVPIKEEDIDSRSSDEDIQDSDSSDNERINKMMHKKGETEDGRDLRLAKQRSYYLKRRVNETKTQRGKRLSKIRDNAKNRRLKESEEERAVRLKEKRIYETQRLENESPEKRALRLKKQRVYQAQRIKRETPEERAQRLKNKRISYQRRRLEIKALDGMW